MPPASSVGLFNGMLQGFTATSCAYELARYANHCRLTLLILVLPATDASGNAISSIVFHSDIRSSGSSDGSGSLAEEEEGPSHAAVIRLTYFYEAFIVLSILLVAGMSPARYGKATTLSSREEIGGIVLKNARFRTGMR